MTSLPLHLLTFDVEHWYEGYRHRNIDGWQNVPPRDHLIVERLFELLAFHGQKATFFFTGRFGRDFPGLVRKCAELGHEVATHSNEHVVIHRMSGEAAFRKDLLTSVSVLSDACGKRIVGYRAPKWSVSPDNQGWVLSALADEGLVYDSSFFPAFGADSLRLKGDPFCVELPSGRQIIEVPATGLNVGPVCFPVAGGLYFRAFPRWMPGAMLRQKEKRRASGMLYVHPYDLDVESPDIAGGSYLFKLARSYGVSRAWGRLERLLATRKFTSIADWLASEESVLPIVKF